LIHHRPTPETPARVIVLGASGFVASELLGHLAGLGVETLGVPSSKVDLRDPASAAVLRGILRPDDVLVFVSALTPDRGRDIRTLMMNLAMAENVCAALETASCAHVVYISSDAVYAEEINPVREPSCCDPSSFHGLMHLTRERMLIQTLKKTKTPLLLLRPSLLFGARDSHNGYGPNRFLRTALSEQTITLFGGGEEKRDHVYIKDLSRLIGLTLLHRTEGVLNAATGKSTSFFEVAQVIAGRLGGGVRVEPTPRQNPITHRHFDVTRGLKAFPVFRYTPIEEALSEVIAEVHGKPKGEVG
jgi:nucleoside-diphosphate-sugar epimerase